LPLCAGIITGLYIQPDLRILVTGLLIILAGFIASLFFNKLQINLLYGLSLTLSLFLCGWLLYYNEKSSLSTLESGNCTFSCTLEDYPEEKENTFSATVKLNCLYQANNSVPLKGSLLLYITKDTALKYLKPGDNMLIRCTPLPIENKANPYEFNYKFFMENQGIRYYAFLSRDALLRHSAPQHRALKYKALIIRQRIIDMFRESGVSENRIGLVAAITLGQKSMLEREQKLEFMKAGVMHIMAVSGLHAIILSLFVFSVLFFMKRKMNFLRILITILILWAFAFVTGLTPSVLRATLMFSFLQVGKLIKRPANGINSVLASAFFLILIRPSVIFDAGFLLSYSAVIYIISFYQGIYQKIIFKNWLADKIWQSVVVTIVAQAGTVPLTIMLFNRFPTYFILANITIVPVSNLLIITGCLLPLFFHFTFVSGLLAVLLNFLTMLTEWLTSTVASLPGSNIENIGMTVPLCILLTCTIFLFCWWIINKKYLIGVIICLLLFVIAGTASDIFIKRTNELIVYNTPGACTIGLRTGKVLNLFSDTSLIRPEVYRHSSMSGLKIKPMLISSGPQCIEVKNKKILIAGSLNNFLIRRYDPDLVILTGVRPGIENELKFNGSDRLIIISSEAASGFRVPQQADASVLNRVHTVRKSGAFIKRI